MEKYYLIAGIKLKMNYHYDDYFKDSIDLYEVSEKSFDHVVSVHLEDHILYNKPVKEGEHTVMMIEDDMRTMYAFNQDHQVKGMVRHDLSYKHVNIHIVPDIIKNPAEIEYTLMGMIFLEIAEMYGFLPWHASAVVYQDEVILISAPSQTGKSTHARLWCEVFKDTYILNDDKPLMRREQDTFLIYSSPFSGKEKKNLNEVKKLKGILFIKQGTDNQIELLNEADKLKEIMRNILRPRDEEIWNHTAHMMSILIQEVPIYRIHATKDHDAVKKAHHALYKE